MLMQPATLVQAVYVLREEYPYLRASLAKQMSLVGKSAG